MNQTVEEITVNGISYVRKDSIKQPVVNTDNLPYCMVRTYSAGVFAGFYKKGDTPKEAVVYQAKRIWSWAGAASLSELAERGTSKPNECKIPMPVSEVYLTEVIEVIVMTEKAIKSLGEVPVWTK